MPVTGADLAVDKELAEISGMLPLLHYVTPVNVAEQRAAFVEGKASEPRFEYRPLPDLVGIGKRLGRVDPDSATDPGVRRLTRDKKRELELRIEMLAARGTDRFFLASVELFGHVEESVLDLAYRLLEEPSSRPKERITVSADEFAASALAEVAAYRAAYPELKAEVVVSDTVSGVRVENGNLYIGSDTRVGLDRVPHLLHHEVGVHVLTYANGSAQPLQLLAVGLARYEENQEALAVLAEYLSGGLDLTRLQILAQRVVAAHLRSERATFAETLHRLVELGAGTRGAFTTAMRCHRAGGMTKDAVYLRGLVRLCEHIAAGASLDGLFIGKMSLEDEPLVRELCDRKVLQPVPLRPRFLDTATARERLQHLREGLSVTEMGRITV